MVTATEKRWLDYAWSVADCPERHRKQCEALGAAVPGPGRVDGNEVRWPGYLGRDYAAGAGVLCVAAVHREARPEEEAPGSAISRTNADLVAAHRGWLRRGRSRREDSRFLESVRAAYEEALPHWSRWQSHFRTLVQDHLGMSTSGIAWTNLAKCRVAIHRGNREAEADLTSFCQRDLAPVSELVEAIRPALVLVSVLNAKPGGKIVSSWDSPSASPPVFSWQGRTGHDRHNTHPDRRRLGEWAPDMAAAYRDRTGTLQEAEGR